MILEAMVYSDNIANQLTLAFENDLKESQQIDKDSWTNRLKNIHL
jgi:cardiolipin synthase